MIDTRTMMTSNELRLPSLPPWGVPPHFSAIDLRAASRCSVVWAKCTLISEIHSDASALLRSPR